jgi:hypothetical protein
MKRDDAIGHCARTRPPRARFKGEDDKHSQTRSFSGAILDTGAEKSVIGKAEAISYCQENGVPFHLKPSSCRFKFGSRSEPAVGRIGIRIPTPGKPLEFQCDVVESDVPLLIGLDTLDKYGLNVMSVEGILQSTTEKWHMPMQRQKGHIYLQWDPGVELFFTRAELIKVHRQFHHPSTNKLMNLLKRADPANVSETTRGFLNEIRSSCETCCRFGPRPQHFQVSLDADRVVFNKEIVMDLMYLNTKPVLHIVDRDTTFSSAKFLRACDRITVWNAFVQCWTSLYTGFPDSILTDQGSVFQSEDWKNACEGAGIILRSTGTESHNSLGVGERYHHPLRRIFEKISFDYQSLDQETALSIATKTMNDLAGPEGLVPSFLVFGVIPRWTTSLPIPENAARLTAIQVARAEYEHLVARMRLATALSRNVPAAADYVFKSGDVIYIYREQQKQWTGPHTISRVLEKAIWVRGDDGVTERQFNVSQCRPAPTILEDDREQSHLQLYTTIVPENDPQAFKFDAAKRAEIDGLFKKGTFRIVERADVFAEHRHGRPNILPCRFVLAVKHEEDGTQRLKARLVVGGHRDFEKGNMLHDASTVRHGYIRLLVSLATIFEFPVWTIDVDQAYLQAEVPLQRRIYIAPKEGVQLRPTELLQLVKPLYGITEAGDYWGETVRSHHLNDLSMTPCDGDLSTYYKRAAQNFSGASATYVDDIIRTANSDFRMKMLETAKKFCLKKPKVDNFRFAGIEIETRGEERIIHQTSYIGRLNLLPKNTTLADFRSCRAQFAWITSTRPDISTVSSQCSSVTEATFSTEWVLILNDAMKYLRQTTDVYLRYPKLDHRTLRMVVYTDGSMANNECSTLKSRGREKGEHDEVTRL